MKGRVRVLPGGAATELEDAIRDYLVNVDARNRNTRTREFYANSLEKVLLPFCREHGVDRLAQLDQRVLDRLAADLQNRKRPSGARLSPATVATYLRGCRQFIKWAGKRVPEGTSVPHTKVPKQDLQDKVLSRREMSALIDATITSRDRALLDLLCNTGLRLGEALALTVDDLVDRGRQGRFVIVRHRSHGGGAKGDSAREIPVRPSLYTALHQLTLNRSADAVTDRLFITNRLSHLTKERVPMAPRTVGNLIDVCAKRAGIKKKVYPHLLRHSFATSWMRATHDPVTLQKILGHSDLSMIANIYSHPSSNDLYSALTNYTNTDED
jgi:site-specific recombinase XerD